MIMLRLSGPWRSTPSIFALASALAVHGDCAMVTGKVDLKMHSARNKSRHARAVWAVLKGHNPEFGKAL
jgi:hypothetical protein